MHRHNSLDRRGPVLNVIFAGSLPAHLCLLAALPRRRHYILLILGFAESLIEGIAGIAHAEDRVTFATGREGFAKTPYMDIDRSIGDVDGWPPSAVQKVLPRKDAARPLEQTCEQPKFPWSEMDVAQAPADPSGLVVELKIASGKQVALDSKPTASQ
jgi:hypothetical protein